MSTSRVSSRIVRFASLQRQPWANGRGQSTEIVALADSAEWTGAATPSWRLSLAELREAGEFSVLPGLDRQFLPIDTTVEMTIDGEVHVVRELTVQSFRGESDVTVTSLTRAGFALNLMVARTPAPGRLQLLAPGEELPPRARPLASLALADEGDVRRFDLVPGERRLRHAHATVAVTVG